MKYQKPSTTVEEQIAIMRNRGLVINDELDAKEHLLFIGYFRLAGYLLCNLSSCGCNDSRPLCKC